MSTVILFTGKYLRQNENIYNCFSVERKRRLLSTVMDRPWANGLNRLLAERRGLKKGQLAEIGHFRPALISAVLSPDTTYPDIESLTKIAHGLTVYDRVTNPHAPDVELWEFFVSDEQAAVLRERVKKTAQASDDEHLLKRGAELFAAFLKEQRQVHTPAPVVLKPGTKKKHA